jgi:hypothetical protein
MACLVSYPPVCPWAEGRTGVESTSCVVFRGWLSPALFDTGLTLEDVADQAGKRFRRKPFALLCGCELDVESGTVLVRLHAVTHLATGRAILLLHNQVMEPRLRGAPVEPRQDRFVRVSYSVGESHPAHNTTIVPEVLEQGEILLPRAPQNKSFTHKFYLILSPAERVSDDSAL